MGQTGDKPKLEFFDRTPEDLISLRPLCSSLQNLESSFFLMALNRFPHALVTCASAIESAMKSALKLDSESRVGATKLYRMARKQYPSLGSFDGSELKQFLDTRNRIVHFGFSPRDDQITSILLLSTGYPFLMACYQEFFDFDLVDSLVDEMGEQLSIALRVYAKAEGIQNLHFTYCFIAFGHLIRWSTRQSLMADWENAASSHAEEIGSKFEHSEKQKSELHRVLGTTWSFDCPICDDI